MSSRNPAKLLRYVREEPTYDYERDGMKVAIESCLLVPGLEVCVLGRSFSNGWIRQHGPTASGSKAPHWLFRCDIVRVASRPRPRSDSSNAMHPAISYEHVPPWQDMRALLPLNVISSFSHNRAIWRRHFFELPLSVNAVVST